MTCIVYKQECICENTKVVDVQEWPLFEHIPCTSIYSVHKSLASRKSTYFVFRQFFGESNLPRQEGMITHHLTRSVLWLKGSFRLGCKLAAFCNKWFCFCREIGFFYLFIAAVHCGKCRLLCLVLTGPEFLLMLQTVVVAQLVERLLPTPEVRSSNPVIYMEQLLTVNCTETTKIKKKEAGNGLFFTIEVSKNYSQLQVNETNFNETSREPMPDCFKQLNYRRTFKFFLRLCYRDRWRNCC